MIGPVCLVQGNFQLVHVVWRQAEVLRQLFRIHHPYGSASALPLPVQARRVENADSVLLVVSNLYIYTVLY